MAEETDRTAVALPVELARSLTALYLEVPPDIADHVRGLVEQAYGGLLSRIEVLLKTLPLASLTCTSTNPQYFVTAFFPTLEEAQAFHEALVDLRERARSIHHF